MKLTQTLSILALIFMTFIIKDCKMIVYVKLTNAVCESFNKSWVTFDTCRLRAISRNKTTLNMEINFLYPTNSVQVRLEIKKRANGYKPWLWNYTIDGCAFMRNRNHPVFRIFSDMLKDFSTINHTCPYTGTQLVKDFYYDPANLTLPVPSGDYLLILTFSFENRPQFVTKVYYIFHQDMFKD